VTSAEQTRYCRFAPPHRLSRTDFALVPDLWAYLISVTSAAETGQLWRGRILAVEVASPRLGVELAFVNHAHYDVVVTVIERQPSRHSPLALFDRRCFSIAGMHLSS